VGISKDRAKFGQKRLATKKLGKQRFSSPKGGGGHMKDTDFGSCSHF